MATIIITLSGSPSVEQGEVDRIARKLADSELWQITGDEEDSRYAKEVRVAVEVK